MVCYACWDRCRRRIGAMRTITPQLRGRLFAAAAAVSLVASVASCGIGAQSGSTASGSPAAAGSTAGSASGTESGNDAGSVAVEHPEPRRRRRRARGPTARPSAARRSWSRGTCWSTTSSGSRPARTPWPPAPRAWTSGRCWRASASTSRRVTSRSATWKRPWPDPPGPSPRTLPSTFRRRSSRPSSRSATRPAPPRATTPSTAALPGWSAPWMPSTPPGCSTRAPTGAKPTPRAF